MRQVDHTDSWTVEVATGLEVGIVNKGSRGVDSNTSMICLVARLFVVGAAAGVEAEADMKFQVEVLYQSNSFQHQRHRCFRWA